MNTIARRLARLMPLSAANGSCVSAACIMGCRRSGNEGILRRKCKVKCTTKRLNARKQWRKEKTEAFLLQKLQGERDNGKLSIRDY